MTDAPARPLAVQTFMTHAMKDQDIAALSTGRDDEFRRVMEAIARSRRASPGSLQHVMLYGSRGFGKSFMMRRLQMAVERLQDDLGPVRYLLLPEEQHNLQRSPYAFLDAIAHKLADDGQDGDQGFEAALFQWPKPGEEARRWDDAAARLEAAADAACPGGKGLVIVVFENFDTLLATLFKEPEDEQRLRAWLDRRLNRVMLLASATGTVDVDYDKPLFQAFDSVRLPPWTVADCIAYFNRHRARDGRPPLDAGQAAKARAIADFIGGTPRLAQLLADVLDTQDALTVAQTMTALADKLAEYYRRRIEDLPSLGRGLLDALIRGGEPASQTELAARVGADGQNLIARPMGDLQAADIVRGRPAPDGRETLYSVTDRVFVHYYRLRQGNRAALTTPLSTILEFLKNFYSRDEQRAQGLRYLEADRPAEAALFSRLAMEGEPRASENYTKRFADWLASYIDAAPDALGLDATAIAAMLESAPASAFELCRTFACASPAASAIASVVKAQALHRLGYFDRAGAELETAATDAVDAASTIIVCVELSRYRSYVTKNNHLAAEIVKCLQTVIPIVASQRVALRGLLAVAWSLAVRQQNQEAAGVAEQAAVLAREIGDKRAEALALRHTAYPISALGRHEEAVEVAGRAAALAEEVSDRGEQAVSLRYMAYSLGELGRHDEAVEVAGRAADLAEEVGEKGAQASSLRYMAFSLGPLGRHDEAVEVAGRAAALAEEVGDRNEQAASLRYMAFSLGQLGRHDEAVEVLGRAAASAEEVGERSRQAESLRFMAFSLGELGRHDEAVEVAGRAADLAEEVGENGLQAESLQVMAFSLGRLGRHKEAWTSAVACIALADDHPWYLSWGAAEALKAALHVARPEIVRIYAGWVEAWRYNASIEDIADPRNQLDDLFVAVARARAFTELDAFLALHGTWLAGSPVWIWFTSRGGEVITRVANAEGRAAGYEAAAGLLPRIAAFMERRPRERRDATWLTDIIYGFAQTCHDPGLLRDVATLLTPELAHQALESAKLIRALAAVDEAPDAGKALARMDPDLATLIRRLRDIPDPPPIVPKRKAGRARKRAG